MEGFTGNTLISTGLVIVLLGAAVSWGVMYQKVSSLTELVRTMTAAIEKMTYMLTDFSERIARLEEHRDHTSK